MKQKLIAIALLFSLSANVNWAAPKHRHHPKTEISQAKPDSSAVAADEVVAYSDTTSLAQDDEDEWDASTSAQSRSININDYDDPFSWFESLSLSTGGVLVACLVLLILLVILLSPFIILALILRFIIKRHNDQVTLAEKAMETGQPIPEELKGVDKQDDEYLWRRGIRNVAIGVGMVIMFWIWNSTMLSGLGALVLCYGLGQMAIARTSAGKKQGNNDELF